MMARFSAPLAALLPGLIAALAAPSQASAPNSLSPVSPARQAQLQAAYGRLPLTFEANQGQTDPQVKFLSRGSGYSLFLTPTQAVMTLHPKKAPASVLRMQMMGASPRPQVTGQDALPGTANYFRGMDPKAWRTGIATYKKIAYKGVYPGVDLVYYGSQNQLEYDFVVRPGADPKRIALSFAGAKSVKVAAGGDLSLGLPGGAVQWHKPVVYQLVDGVCRPIAGRYVVQGHEARFQVGQYDTAKPLIIDPTLAYSTYLGGSGGESGNAIAVDSSGDAYVTGNTSSTDFPTTSGALQTTSAGSGDAFVAKLNASGTALVYSTYLGGSGIDSGHAVAIDSSGDAYVTGYTSSSDFPTTSGALRTTSAGSGDAFVAKLNASGTALAYSTYLGGSGSDSGQGITVGGSGSVYVTGNTSSTDFPTTSGALQTTSAGSGDAFVAKLNASGTALVYSTYLGGSGSDSGQGIAIDSSGDAYVTGYTSSSDFPTTSGALRTTSAGSGDAFVAKLNASGTALVYSTYLGGSGSDSGSSIGLDSSGSVYVTGSTSSTDFPTTSGALQTTSAGSGDAFVAKLNASGTALVYSTYLGGSGIDFGNAVAIDSSGDAYVTGYTSSSDFPTTSGALQTTSAGSGDAFVAKLNASGTALAYSTYLGGSGSDYSSSIGLDGSGDAYVTGYTSSSDFPTTSGAFQTTYSGGAPNTASAGNAFVTKLNASGTALVYSTYLGGSGSDFGNAIAVGSSGSVYVTGYTGSSNFPTTSGAFQIPRGGGVIGAFVAKFLLANTHLLWTNTNGMAAIWTINPAGSVTSTPGYGPISQWAARTIADGPDGKTRLLWTRADGMNAVWTVNTADNSIISTPGYGPIPGWNVVSLAVGPDNLTRLQWKRASDGMSSVWTLGSAGSGTSTPAYGPYGSWTADALAVGADSFSRLLWGDGSGQFSVWTIDGSGGITSTPAFGPIPGWSSLAIAGGPDADARLLLNRTDGAMAVWTVDVPGSVTSTPLYGPIPNWTCHALAVGPDALSRVLWSRSDGMSSVWTLHDDGSVASTPGYGPYSGWGVVALSAGP